MPELPEVETTRRGILPHILGRVIRSVTLRNRDLRWRVAPDLGKALSNQVVRTVDRRGKYLILGLDRGSLIVHLGMSGSLRIVPVADLPGKHDHVDIVFADGPLLRYRDPRRFGAMIYTRADPMQHALLRHLGPEPLADDCSGEYLYRASRGRKQAVKSFIMDSRILVGVGNIYASESLFLGGIHPRRAAGRIALPRYERLLACIREVLLASIETGGTTLRDFVSGSGQAGYFRQQLQVYERAGEPCRRCGAGLRLERIGQRSSYYCPLCQR